jgi:pimeloyl-ACP methyl ester carboxylesterase
MKESLHSVARRSSLGLAARIAPRWTLQTASRWFLTPPRHRQPAAEATFLQTGNRHPLSMADGSLMAWQFGDPHAPAIIASHGWGGRGGQFRALTPALIKAGFQVWVFDHVGHGQSGGQEATLVDFAAGLRRVHTEVESRGVRVHGYIGHSLGSAAIAVALAGKDGLSPLADHGRGRRVLLIAPPASLVRYSRIFARHLGLPERIRHAMQWRIEQRLGLRWEDFELPDAAQDLRAEALIIHDQQDRDVSLATGLSVARGWPDARFRRTHGLGHYRILRDPGVLRDARDFFTGEVIFSPPPSQDEWDSFPGPAPLW